ncbi:MAG: sigma-70 family RNA polymerase sigma factor [Gemmataceae bacterium]
MPEATTTQLQGLIDRVRRGDHGARRELLERAHGRLRKLAGKMLGGSFPALQAGHDLDSVVNEGWLRLVQALDRTDPPTVADFFRLAAFKIRQVLLDMAERSRRHQARAGGSTPTSESAADPSDRTHDPGRLALWSELHEKVAALPEREREVFDLHYYMGLPQSEIAATLGLSPRKVSYLWVAATNRLASHLSEAEGLL